MIAPPTPARYYCNLCGGRATPLLAGPPRIVRCDDCSLSSLEAFPAPAEREAAYQEEYYREGSGERFLGLFERMVSVFRRLRMRSIVRRCPGPGAILDVGCGRGLLPALFLERGWVAAGTQISRTAAAAAHRRYGVNVLVGELPELPLQAGAFDVVTLFHVLEHLDRPEAYLRKAHELLAPGGLLVVEVPNFASPGFRILGTRNFCMDFPNHLVFFTPDSLGRLLARCGFTVEEVSHFSLEYSPYTTLQNMLNLLPGDPGRLYRSLMGNEEGGKLRKSPITWLHALLACALAPTAFLLSLAGLVAPVGNTMRFYCRKGGESRE
jgi:SAM-dependent methyltransferase